MRALAGQVLLIAVLCATTTVGVTQTLPLADRPLQNLEIAQYRPVPRAPTAAASGEGRAVAKVNNWTVGLGHWIAGGHVPSRGRLRLPAT